MSSASIIIVSERGGHGRFPLTKTPNFGNLAIVMVPEFARQFSPNISNTWILPVTLVGHQHCGYDAQVVFVIHFNCGAILWITLFYFIFRLFKMNGSNQAI
jgi:hypothetical protein